MRLKLCIAVVLGLCLSARAGAQSWERVGPSGGMVVSLGASSTGRVYLGTADGHVFVSEDGARHWELRGRVGGRTDTVVARLLPDPSAADRVFAAVWFQEAGAGGGVFQSDDGGVHWRQIGLEGEAVRALEHAPSQPNILVAGTRSGMFRSSDAGKSWERISPQGDEELRNVDSLAIDPADPKVIYAGTYHLPWKTTDGGKSWKSVISGLIDDSDIMSLRVDATNPARLFLSACSGIYRSENQGAAWTKLQGIPYGARRTHAIVQDPGNPKTLFAATIEGLWVTRDSCENWKRTTPKSWVINGIVVLPASSNVNGRVMMGTEAQGILTSDDDGESFHESNDGFTHTTVKQLIGDPGNPQHLAMLVEKGGQEIRVSQDGGRTWNASPGAGQISANGGLFNAELVAQLYTSPWGWLARLNNGQLWIWSTEPSSQKQLKLQLWKPAVRTGRARAGEAAAAVRAPVSVTGNALAFDLQNLYAATKDGVVRCNRDGACEVLRAFHGARISALRVSPDGKYIDVAAGSKIGRSADGGEEAVWIDLPAGAGEIRFLRTGADPQTLFLGTDRGVFVSGNGGGQWTVREEGLPPGQLEQWFQGTGFLSASLHDGGVYVSRDGGKSWDRIDQDAERGRTTGIVETQPGVLLVGSQSEGILRWVAGNSR